MWTSIISLLIIIVIAIVRVFMFGNEEFSMTVQRNSLIEIIFEILVWIFIKEQSQITKNQNEKF